MYINKKKKLVMTKTKIIKIISLLLFFAAMFLFSLIIIVVLFVQMDDCKIGDDLPFTYILLIVTSIIYCCSQVIESFREW